MTELSCFSGDSGNFRFPCSRETFGFVDPSLELVQPDLLTSMVILASHQLAHHIQSSHRQKDLKEVKPPDSDDEDEDTDEDNSIACLNECSVQFMNKKMNDTAGVC